MYEKDLEDMAKSGLSKLASVHGMSARRLASSWVLLGACTVFAQYEFGIGGLRDAGAWRPLAKVSEDADAATIDGPIEKLLVRRVIKTHLTSLAHCVRREKGVLEGRVVVKFIISPTGMVTQAMTRDSTLGDATADECLAYAVRRMYFPKPDDGGAVRVSWPFVFSKKADVDGGVFSENEKAVIAVMGSGPSLTDVLGDGGTLLIDEGVNSQRDAFRNDDSLSKDAIQRVAGERTIGVSSYAPDLDGGAFGRTWVTDEPEAMTVVGSLEKAQIRRVLKQRKDALLLCARSANDAQGSVVVSFIIGPEGTVTESKVKETTLGDAAGCVARTIRSMVFPKPIGGGVVMVTWPAVFTRDHAQALAEGPTDSFASLGLRGTAKDAGMSEPSPMVMGSLAKDRIQEVIRAIKPALAACAGKSTGKVSVRFVISATGAVNMAEIKDTTLNSPAAEQCIAHAVKDLKFPRPSGGGVVVVIYPFVFTAAQ